MRKRLRVAFHDGTREHVGFTINLSRTGFSLHSNFLLQSGAEMTGRIALPEGPEIDFVGQVRWVRKLRGEDVLYALHAMGVMFLSPPGGAYASFLRDPTAPGPAERPRASVRPAPDPPPEPQRPANELTAAQAAAAPPPLAETLLPGREGRMDATIHADDLAAPGDVYECSLSAGRAAMWMEQAAVRAVASALPGWACTVGVSLQLTVVQAPATTVGAKVTAMARLDAVSADGRELTFTVAIWEGSRVIARAKHVRIVVEPRRRGTH